MRFPTRSVLPSVTNDHINIDLIIGKTLFWYRNINRKFLSNLWGNIQAPLAGKLLLLDADKRICYSWRILLAAFNRIWFREFPQPHQNNCLYAADFNISGSLWIFSIDMLELFCRNMLCIVREHCVCISTVPLWSVYFKH